MASVPQTKGRKGFKVERVRLGKTELMVTQLGFGGIPIQRLAENDAIKVVQRCLDLGINFFDTANAYTTSEERIGKAVKGRRDEVIIATKTFPGRPETIEEHLNLSLQRLGTDYIDLYQFHGVNNIETSQKIVDPEDGLIKVFARAKQAGKIRHIGITSHQIDAAKWQVRTGLFETLMFPFNIIANEPATELLPLCQEHDVGFIVMKPLAGGMLANVPLCFRYLLQFPGIVSIPGIETREEIEEIYRLYERPSKLSTADHVEMKRMAAELGNQFCRRCDYCQPCPQEISISLVMSFDTIVKRMPPHWYLENPHMVKELEKADTCIECGECESRCPFNLPIPEILKKRYALYEKVKANTSQN